MTGVVRDTALAWRFACARSNARAEDVDAWQTGVEPAVALVRVAGTIGTVKIDFTVSLDPELEKK